jgi:hypothetical protein
MRLRKVHSLALAVAAIAILGLRPVRAQIPPGQAGEATVYPKIGCGDLRSLTGYEFTVESAILIPGTGNVPEYCRVRGQILPEIRFEVNLPAAWNLRFYMYGNGGFAGEPLDSPQRAIPRSAGVRAGFVVAGTDTGHDGLAEPLATFSQNRQKLLDYAFRSLHTTAETGKRIATAYYGSKPAHSYFEGCSTGGRQALILAQRFPDDFDGIISGAPVLNFTGTMMSSAKMAQALAKNPIPYAKLKLLADRIYALCDEKDGLKDGLIDDPRRCDFQPARDLPKCAEGSDTADCFTSGQIASLETIYGDVMSQGKRVFPGWPVSGEVMGPNGRSGWDAWKINAGNQPSISVAFGDSFFRYMASPDKNHKIDFATFDFETDPARLEWIHGILDATDPDLSRFNRRGGKLLMYFGWADPALNPQMGIDYYESVVARMGPATPSFFRLFMVPGMFHCGGGVGCDHFDRLGPVIQWVEKGIAPDSIVASRISGGKADRTRPLCPYPQAEKYKGSGSIDDAASFVCK